MGLDVRKQAEKIRTHSGALLEFSGLYVTMSAEDNLDLYGRMYKLSTVARCTRSRELLEHLVLWGRRKDRGGAWWEIDWFVRSRVIGHLQRRSQRPYRPPSGVW
jgi:ABC-2 type transport system ATP-binding protein